MRYFAKVGAIAILASLAIGCVDKSPYYGHAETYDRSHLQFGSSDLESATRIEPATATRDQAGLLHITVNIRSVIDKQQYIDCFCTFLRNGQPIDKQGPKKFTLKGNLFDTVTFVSSQPADDYFISLDYAK